MTIGPSLYQYREQPNASAQIEYKAIAGRYWDHKMRIKFTILCLTFIIVVGTAAFTLASETNTIPGAPTQKLTMKPTILSSELSRLKSAKWKSANRKISTRLSHVISQQAALRTKERKVPLTKRERKILEKEKIRVIFHVDSDNGLNLDGLKARGAKILSVRSNLVAVEVPIDKIEDIATHVAGIGYARFPHKLFPAGVMDEGVSLTGATNYHAAGYTGSGIKIAIMDVGFKGLSEAQSNGDMPYDVITHDYSGKGLQTQYKHGTACAEIVHDMAPDAELHLLKLADEVEFYMILDYCIQNDIDIISGSIGFYGSGPGNGTGPVCEAADELRANGILVVASAGNSANSSIEDMQYGSHWKGMFYDSDDDAIHEFIQGDAESWYNGVDAFPYQDDDGNPETNDVTIVMRWNDWPNANVDYDLYLFHYFSGELAGSSFVTQDGSQPPIEAIVIDLPDNEEFLHYYYIVVDKYSGESSDVEIELFLGGMTFFTPFYKYTSPIATSASSIMEPADAVSVLAVGAINYENWEVGPQEDFISQGPTNAWAGSSARTKPDISGPDGVSGHTYGESAFLGTSAAAPHVAGAAALILSMHPNLSPDELRAVIESTALDMGDEGKDNYYGYGRLNINPYNNAPAFTSIGNRTVDEGELLTFALAGSDPDKDDLVYLADDLPQGAGFDINTHTFTWTPDETQGGIYVIRLEVSDGLDTHSENIAITVNDVLDTVAKEADLVISKTVDNSTPYENDMIVYTITLVNNGPSAATGVTVSDQLPDGVSFISAIQGQGAYTSGTGVWTVGDISSDASAILTINATVDSGTADSTITNTASVSTSNQSDPVSGNNSGSAGIAVTAREADLDISKMVDLLVFKENDTIVYTVTLANKGPDDTTNVTVTDQLPNGISFVSATAEQGFYLYFIGKWMVGSLAKDDSAVLTINATVNSGTLGTTITNTASISSSDLSDPTSSNDSSSVNMIVAPENPGDVDNSGSIDSTDVLFIMDIIFGEKIPTIAEFARANVDTSNQKIDITDLLAVIDIVSRNQ